MNTRSKPRHELCVDKTSCKSEAESRLNPAANLTKNTVKQQQVHSQQQSEPK